MQSSRGGAKEAGEREGRAFQNVEPPYRPAWHGSILALLGFLGLCLLVGFASGAITALNVRTWYPSLVRPPGTPPNVVFGPVWTVLYVTVGLSAWLVWRQLDRAVERSYRALRLWGWQLLLNALWTPAFFGLHSLSAALVVIVLLVMAVALTIRAFAAIDRRAAVLLLPYLGWTTYAAYLTAGFWTLNPH